MMEGYFAIIMGAIFINNFVLIRFLGICPFIGVSGRTVPALGMGLAVTFVLGISAFFTWMLQHFVLIPFDAEYLNIVVFIFVIASLVQIVELFMRWHFKSLYNLLGIYLPLITTNCAVLALSFMNALMGYNIIESVVHGISVGIGFSLALLLMSGIRERLSLSDVPRPFRNVPIAFITAALMSIAFLGFAGLR